MNANSQRPNSNIKSQHSKPEGDEFIKNPWQVFISEARLLPGFSIFDAIHGYLYSHHIYRYIAFGTGEYPLARMLNKVRQLLTGNRFPQPVKKAYSVAANARSSGGGVAQSYHGKVLPLTAARELVSVRENINLPDLENIVPFNRARDLVMLNPDHITVLDCPCRAAREHPCQPLDVCLIIGEPFASLVLDRYPTRSRRIDAEEACDILQAEDDRGHVHHAFFKDAMLGRFYALCNCCTCCCGAMHAQANGTPMLISSGYVCIADENSCEACGVCMQYCQFSALSMGDFSVKVDLDACMGCGVCVSKCPSDALSLVRDETRPQPLEIHTLLPTSESW